MIQQLYLTTDANMNSKERVTACIMRKPIDAVPLGFYLVDHDTIAKVIGRPTYVCNRVATQMAFWEGRRAEVVESMKADVVEFYRKIDLCDIITFKEACPVPPKDYIPEKVRQIAADCWEDQTGRVYQLSAVSNEFICIKDPTIQPRNWTRSDFQTPLPETPPDPSTLEVYDYMLRHLSGDRYIAGLTAGFHLIRYLGGQEQGLMEYALNPDLVTAAMKQKADYQTRMDKYYLRPDVTGVLMESDMCSTKGPMISPQSFREVCLPSVISRIASLKNVHHRQILLHSCGNTRLIIPDLIKAGMQVYQSIQNIPEMWVGDLKKEFGDRLVLWGGMPVEELVLGTPATVRTAVRRAMEAAAPGGGFIFGPSHSIAFGTRYDNFMAMLDEFNKLRFKF